MIQLHKGEINMTPIYIGIIFIVVLQLVFLIIIKQTITKTVDLENQKTREINHQQTLQLIERNTKFERATKESLDTFSNNLVNSLNNAFSNQYKTIEMRLSNIDHKVNESLSEGFDKTQKTFTNIVERLSKIDEAQKKIETLSTDITDLQSILTDKSSRGAFGEMQLNQILTSIFGDKNDSLYQTQYTFQTGSRADAVIFAPKPLGTVAIDSKFPLENYRKTLEDESHSKQFRLDLKKHIDDIAQKYIIPEETSDQAILFLPAEAIFAYVNAYFPDVVEYSHKKRVWLTSPTTLMSTLTTIQTIIVNLERDKYAEAIQQELKLLEIEFIRFRERWDKLNNRIDRMTHEIKDINITTEKITNRFEQINSVEHTKKELD